MRDYIAKADVVTGIEIIKVGLAMAGFVSTLESLTEGDTPKGYEALGSAEAFAQAVKGIDAFLADLGAFPEDDVTERATA